MNITMMVDQYASYAVVMERSPTLGEQVVTREESPTTHFIMIFIEYSLLPPMFLKPRSRSLASYL